MTDNKYWLFLEDLRKSGVTNMWGAAPYLKEAFGLSDKEAKETLSDWIRNYNRNDYVVRTCCKCGKEHLTSGFVVHDGEKYYCSEDCLYKDYTEQEYVGMYENNEAYWTEFEE